MLECIRAWTVDLTACSIGRERGTEDCAKRCVMGFLPILLFDWRLTVAFTFSQRMYDPNLPHKITDNIVLRSPRPYEADKGCQVGGTQGDRGIPSAEGGRIQEVRGRGEEFNLCILDG